MCGIRELMKATSKTSTDKAAAKKVTCCAKHGAVSDSSTIKGATAEAAGPSQQHDRQLGNGKKEDGANVSVAGRPSQLAGSAAASTSASATDADEPSASTASAAAEGAKQQSKQGVGNKRDIEEDSSSSSSGITKRLKANPDSSEVTDKTGTQSGSASDAKAEQTDDAGTSKSAAASTSGPSARSTATSQHNQQHADVSTQSSSQTVDWLLAQYSEVAAAADQQVHKTCNYGVLLMIWHVVYPVSRDVL